MPVLQFKGKTAVECYHYTIPHHTLEFDGSTSVIEKGQSPSLGGNLIIEGDNLLALKALLPTHAGLIKCIYKKSSVSKAAITSSFPSFFGRHSTLPMGRILRPSARKITSCESAYGLGELVENSAITNPGSHSVDFPWQKYANDRSNRPVTLLTAERL